MSYKVLLSTTAESDLKEIYDWYEFQKNGLGGEFLIDAEASFQLLSEFPHYQIRYGQIRYKSLKRFPHLIHFQIKESSKEVWIEAILHPSKFPRDFRKG